uniref:Uncharacterized protein n=1 Tax=Guillardia theta TaxID=55529 RepID=A0A6U5ZYI7_GUITH|mmetsp:Transcript_29673/g.94956  ORF Transcript_29673/g.94956 Transcript_29673/m.94956 type:complete len:1198 (+) Transcript_29673:67-3660(+)
MSVKDEEEELEEQSSLLEEADEGAISDLPTFFVEAGEVQELLQDLKEASVQRISGIFDKYQEQPQLLDANLETIVSTVFSIIQDQGERDSEVLRNCCCVLYTLTKVRGHKVLTRFFPHRVADIEPCLALLAKQNPKESNTWEIRFILFLWLSILVMVPFSLDTVDSTILDGSEVAENANGDGLVDRIVNICKSCLYEAAKTRDAAAFLLGKLLTRPDMEDGPLVSFLKWCRLRLEQEGMHNSLLATGIHQALAHIFRQGQRKSLLDKVPLVLDILHYESSQNKSTLQRHLVCKLSQRIGLTYLPPRVVTWRYNRGHRSLLDNLKGNQQSVTEAAEGTKGAKDAEDDDDDSYVPLEIEYVIDSLLQGLCDRDSVVRWSAAKGIGRVTSRLPKHLADEVVGAVIDLFSTQTSVSVNSWHGGCLALAELARRGLLLPHRLQAVVQLVVRALKFDVRRGSASVGANVRDAASFVCWAFARAYAPSDMLPHVPELAKGLLVQTVLDREINCRRAASAAFQENVGRQGNYPHGIDIVTRTDYFAVGNRSNSFLVVAPYISLFEAYQEGIIEYVVEFQLRHWDKNIRLLSASLLRLLGDVCAPRLITSVLPTLLDLCMSPDVPTRHGAACGIAEIVHGLDLETNPIPNETMDRIRNLVQAVEKARLFRGRGGEMMRSACSKVLESLGQKDQDLTPKLISSYFDSLAENLKHPTEEISCAAVAAVHALSRKQFGKMSEKWKLDLVQRYVTMLEDDNPASRRGFALALGALGKEVLCLQNNLEKVLLGLASAATTIQEVAEERDGESRRNAVKAFVSVAETVGVEQIHTSFADGDSEIKNTSFLIDTLLKCLGDYCVDNRGDVGSWVREAAMVGLVKVVKLLSGVETNKEHHWSAEMCGAVFQGILKQLAEKIDRTRSVAGKALKDLLSQEPSVSYVNHREILDEVIREPVDWNSAGDAFARVAKLLTCDDYRHAVISGMVISIGGISESLVKHSWASLTSFLSSSHDPNAQSECILNDLLRLIEDSSDRDNVVIPTLKTLHLLLSNSFLDHLDSDASELPRKLLEITQSQLRGCKDVVKLEAGISVVASLLQLQGESLKEPSLQTLLALTCHRFPRIRRKAAEELYMQLLTRENLIAEENFADATQILSERDWTVDVSELRPQRDQLYVLFSITPKTESKSNTTTGKKTEKEDIGYMALVRDMHY